MDILKKLWQYARHYQFLLYAGIIILIFNIGLSMVPGYINRKVIDEVITGGKIDILPRLLLILIIITVLRSTFKILERLSLEKFSQNTLLDLKQSLYDHLQKLSFNFFNKNKTGELMSRMTGDMEAIRVMLIEGIFQITQIIFYLILTSMVLFRLNVQLTLISLVSSPFIAFFTYKMSKKIKPAFRKVREQFSTLNSTVQENISGIRVVKAFNREDFEMEKFNEDNVNYYKKRYRVARIWGNYSPFLQFFGAVSTLFLLFFGGRLVIQGQITMGIWMQFNSYLWMLIMPMRMLGNVINMVNFTVASGERVFKIMEVEPEIKNTEKPVSVTDFKGEVEFRNINITFEDQKILEDINLTVSPGETVAIMGATGAGKSSLINLIGRYYDPDRGSVYIDGIDIKKMDLKTLREQIAVVMQETFLFSETIKNNIAYGCPEADIEEIKEAAKIAGAHEFILEMEAGYETVIGERGMGLSGGQKQRISLARAILKRAPILILDDSTSAVDMETERQIYQALESMESKATVFLIAHRISTVRNADKILILKDGKIVEKGTHKELLKQKGEYYGIFQEQHKEFLNEEYKKLLVVS
ncbi:MAG: ABC transporter ATP-binding protein [Halanaerobiaceae bacterium]